ncbi:EAL domain-containing protein [Marinobacter sp.]|uniref:EAL domain-containing protein n=1 Tax=Marinobacter sp. TaxID=50741 RepID=UPI003A8F250F
MQGKKKHHRCRSSVALADRNLVTATIAMAHSLGLRVVAEGVETREQLGLLEELGCDIAQGFYFSKPIPAKELASFKYTENP